MELSTPISFLELPMKYRDDGDEYCPECEQVLDWREVWQESSSRYSRVLACNQCDPEEGEEEE